MKYMAQGSGHKAQGKISLSQVLAHQHISTLTH